MFYLLSFYSLILSCILLGYIHEFHVCSVDTVKQIGQLILFKMCYRNIFDLSLLLHLKWDSTWQIYIYILNCILHCHCAVTALTTHTLWFDRCCIWLTWKSDCSERRANISEVLVTVQTKTPRFPSSHISFGLIGKFYSYILFCCVIDYKGFSYM